MVRRIIGYILLASMCFAAPVVGLAATLVDFNVSITGTECFDGIDNDRDGLTDFPDDTSCDSVLDDDEGSVAPPSSGGGGGGGNSRRKQEDTGSISFSGLAYPGGEITLLENSRIIATTTADIEGFFAVAVTNRTATTYTFLLTGTDTEGGRSTFLSFPLAIIEGKGIQVSDIFVPPTITIVQNPVDERRVTIRGHTMPNAAVDLLIAPGDRTVSVAADQNGVYTTQVFITADEEAVSFKARAMWGELTSTYGEAVNFDSEIVFTSSFLSADLNTDGEVDLIDFSILIAWFHKTGFPSHVDINRDGMVNLVDFSILTSHWSAL